MNNDENIEESIVAPLATRSLSSPETSSDQSPEPVSFCVRKYNQCFTWRFSGGSRTVLAVIAIFISMTGMVKVIQTLNHAFGGDRMSDGVITGAIVWLIPVGSLQIVIMYECYVHKWCIALPVPLAFAFFSLFTSIGFFSASHVQSILVKGPFDNDYEAEARQQLIRRNLIGGFILLAISVIFMIEACVVYAFQRLHGHDENIFLKSQRPSSAEQMVQKLSVLFPIHHLTHTST